VRGLFGVLFLLCVACSALCQSMSQEQVIRRMIDTGVSEGHDQKVIGGMGDAAAVMVTKILADRKVSPSEVDSVLVVLDSSFADPRAIDVASDREPRAALFLLRCLELDTSDIQLKRRIGETKNRIVNVFAKFVHSDSVR
jgi:hypothetical protein